MSADYTGVRAAAFFALFALILALETLRPRRRNPMQRRMRWPSNLGLMAINAAMIGLLPFAAAASAIWAQSRGLGLLHFTVLPPWLEVLAAWLVLDVAIYWQHRALHEVGWLWPLHRVHHTDVELDATTGVRFHAAEIVLSMAYKCVVVIALGAPLLAVLLFEIALSGLSLFNHANLHLPARLDRMVRMLLVTPDMHRAHHSVHRDEHDSNYGNALSWWDHLFRSYTRVPRDGHAGMRIGLAEFRHATDQRLVALLKQPMSS
jgi:sterol desaturase/sphingolipid hydroxylase (fatty acid hydroxylase superfamily)